MDTLTACKVDTSHGTDCNSAQIIVEVLGVTIPPGSSTDIPRPDNSTELLGGDQVQYKATVIQGANPVNLPVKWSQVDNSGLNLINIVDPFGLSGVMTVQPQSVFQNNVFFVDITATAVDQNGNPIDPTVAVSAPFGIRIAPATVTMTTTPTPGPNDKLPTPPATLPTFEARVNRPFSFAANVDGPQNPNNRVIKWDESFTPTLNDFSVPGLRSVNPNNPNAMDYVISSPPPKGDTVSTTIRACVGGHIDSSILGSLSLKDATCAEYVLALFSPIFPTSLPPVINSGESKTITITGTGFGSAPFISPNFGDPNIFFQQTSVSGPDANGVTTVTGTLTALPVPTDTGSALTIRSSLSPPRTPVNQSVSLLRVFSTPVITPGNATLIVSQSQQFTPSLGCQTLGGQTCTVAQTSTCSLISGPGTMSTGCLYTAPASVAAQSTVQAQACFTFGGVCKSFSIILLPVTVGVSPATASLAGGQSQQLQATVTNVPNNNQGVTWSINPAVGSISAAGIYTAPALVTASQSVIVKACSVVDPSQCGSATVTLVPPDFDFSVAQSTGLSAPAFQYGFNLTVTAKGGFAGNVTFSATVPSGIGMSSSLSPATVTGSGTSVATFPVLSSTPTGTYPVTITATSGSLVHSVQITVTVVPPPTLSLTVSPPQTASAGQTVTFTFAVSWTNFFGGVSVNATGIPPGSTASQIGGTFFGPDTGTLTISTPATLAPGDYNLTFTASGNGLITSGSSSLNVSLTKTAGTTLSIPAPPPPPPPPPPDGCTPFCLDQ